MARFDLGSSEIRFSGLVTIISLADAGVIEYRDVAVLIGIARRTDTLTGICYVEKLGLAKYLGWRHWEIKDSLKRLMDANLVVGVLLAGSREKAYLTSPRIVKYGPKECQQALAGAFYRAIHDGGQFRITMHLPKIKKRPKYITFHG
jgi:hypothetical protein